MRQQAAHTGKQPREPGRNQNSLQGEDQSRGLWNPWGGRPGPTHEHTGTRAPRVTEGGRPRGQGPGRVPGGPEGDSACHWVVTGDGTRARGHSGSVRFLSSHVGHQTMAYCSGSLKDRTPELRFPRPFECLPPGSHS